MARQLQALERTHMKQDLAALISRLGAAVSSKTAEMDESIALKSSRKDEEAMAILRSNRGKALMDEIDVFISGITRVADERLTSVVEEQRANAAMLRWVSIVGGFVILVVVGIVVAARCGANRSSGSGTRTGRDPAAGGKPPGCK
jgi:CHASE3 domain sensor protein